MNINELEGWLVSSYLDSDVVFYDSPESEIGVTIIGGFFDGSQMIWDDEPEITFAVYINPDTYEITTPHHLIEEDAHTTYHHEMRHVYQYSPKPVDIIQKEMGRSLKQGIEYRQDLDEIDAFGSVDLPVFIQIYGWDQAWLDEFSPLKQYVDIFGKGSVEVKRLIKKAVKVLDSV